jgi:hypothetical protein
VTSNVDAWVNAAQFAAIEASLMQLSRRWPHRREIPAVLRSIRRHVAYRASEVPEREDDLTGLLADLHAALLSGSLDAWLERAAA